MTTPDNAPTRAFLPQITGIKKSLEIFAIRLVIVSNSVTLTTVQKQSTPRGQKENTMKTTTTNAQIEKTFERLTSINNQAVLHGFDYVFSGKNPLISPTMTFGIVKESWNAICELKNQRKEAIEEMHESMDAFKSMHEENLKLKAALENIMKTMEGVTKPCHRMTDLAPLPPAWVTNPMNSMTPMSKQSRI